MREMKEDFYESAQNETQPPVSSDLASVESPEQPRVSNSSYQGDGITATELKERISLRRVLEADGLRVISGGKNKKCLCPFHHESTPSFVIWNDDQSAKCFGCGWTGDIFTYVMDRDNVTFSEAFKRLQRGGMGVHHLSPRKATAKRQQKDLKGKEVDALRAAAERLAGDIRLCENVASKRQWQSDTIRKLAEEGSLGWTQGALAFNYETGMKLRNWPHHALLWEFGSGSTWRRNQAKDANEIIICEGETDAISLIDKGLDDDPEFAVVALPSASTITSDLVDVVRGKNVTLCMDDDEAGRRAADKLVDLLEPVCASIKIFSFEEVAQ